MKHCIWVIALFVLTNPCPLRADPINYNALDREGFSDVGALLKDMTPEQRQAVMKEAATKQNELKQMTPAQRSALNEQLRDTANTIRMEDIDPNKLDPAKSKNVSDTQKDLDSYQRKYQQRQIHNSAVRKP